MEECTKRESIKEAKYFEKEIQCEICQFEGKIQVSNS